MFLFITLHLNFVFGQGIKGGLHLANASGDEAEDAESRIGFAIGGFLTLSLSDQFSLRPEVYYSSKGLKIKVEESESSNDYEYSFSGESTLFLNYVDIPILGVFAVSKNFNLFGGPYLDVFLNGEAKSESEGYYRYLLNNEWVREDLSGSESEDIESDEINSPGYGLVFGAEYVLGNISLDVRYSVGLSNIPDEDEIDLKHKVIQFMVGLYF